MRIGQEPVRIKRRDGVPQRRLRAQDDGGGMYAIAMVAHRPAARAGFGSYCRMRTGHRRVPSTRRMPSPTMAAPCARRTCPTAMWDGCTWQVKPRVSPASMRSSLPRAASSPTCCTRITRRSKAGHYALQYGYLPPVEAERPLPGPGPGVSRLARQPGGSTSPGFHPSSSG
jgi:hypothetical protein